MGAQDHRDRRPPATGGETGVAAGGRHLTADILHFLDLRLQLALLEGKEAGARFAHASVLALAGAALLLVADLALSAAVVGLATGALSQVWPWVRWEFVAIAVAAIHLAAGFAALHSARHNSRRRPFSASLDELKKDHQWLAHERTTPPR